MHIVQRENDHFVVTLEDETGIGTIDVYNVFPGIYLGYSDFRLQNCKSDFLGQSEMIGVEHCREGKIEWELKNGDFAYLGSESLISCCYGKNEGYFQFPNHSYQGLSFALELPKKGEFLVLAGGSGSGKTTVTRLLNGLIPDCYSGKYTGTVRICNKNPQQKNRR